MQAMASRRHYALAFFLLPGLAYITIVRILPAVSTLFFSFTTWNLKEQSGPAFAGMRNYRTLISDVGFLESVVRTLGFAAVATACELALGLILALLVNNDFIGKRLMRTCLLTPMVITPAVVGMMWYILFHDTIGPLNAALGALQIAPVPWLSDPSMALISVLIADIWHWTPFTFLILLAALQVVPAELYESAEMDGATRWQTLVLITLPMIRSALVVAALLRSMDAFEIFAEPFVMTGGGPGNATDMLSVHIYKAAFLFFDLGYASAMIVVSVGILVLLYGVYLRFARLEKDNAA
jgi:multiple sugar transport system permease protein